ncbi:MAG TPA: hypothetical protein VG297_05745 [Bryobacteraceae bacterium]|jgi:hypothetical protein|nr:hypothetical protein [Bryobacteraceae bacterium]
MKNFLLAAAALASPLIWFASLWAGFALAPITCTSRSNAALWIVAAASLLLVCGSGVVAWSQWNQPQPEGNLPARAPMPRWLAMSGIVLSGGFFIVIVAQAIPSLILNGCE